MQERGAKPVAGGEKVAEDPKLTGQSKTTPDESVKRIRGKAPASDYPADRTGSADSTDTSLLGLLCWTDRFNNCFDEHGGDLRVYVINLWVTYCWSCKCFWL